MPHTLGDLIIDAFLLLALVAAFVSFFAVTRVPKSAIYYRLASIAAGIALVLFVTCYTFTQIVLGQAAVWVMVVAIALFILSRLRNETRPARRRLTPPPPKRKVP